MTATSYASAGSGRAVAADADTLVLPRLWKPDGSRIGVVWCHSSGGAAKDALDHFNKPGTARVVKAIADAGYPVAATDMGGSNTTWGNATGQARIGSARSWLQSAAVGAKAGKVIVAGTSMGTLNALNYARSNPANVAAVLLILPAIDMQKLRVDNYDGTIRGLIDTAWGVVYPATLPAGANPTDTPTDLAGVPIGMWYADDDPFYLSSTLVSYASSQGSAAPVSVGSLGHTEAAVAAVPTGDVVGMIDTA